MKLITFIFFTIFICYLSKSSVFASTLRIVPITIQEALDQKDTTSSERYRTNFERTVRMSTELVQNKLKACGYKFDIKIDSFSASETIDAYEAALKAEKSGSWFILGPRRSN